MYDEKKEMGLATSVFRPGDVGTGTRNASVFPGGYPHMSGVSSDADRKLCRWGVDPDRSGHTQIGI
jgi:hypothetical protein